jgi:hypothetical protein
MKTEQITTYNWQQDVGPELLKNLNEILEAKGIEPLHDLHGGRFKDGKWVGFGIETNDYRNYWHAYIELWGERLFNDSYQNVWFNDADDDSEWDYCRDRLRAWSSGRYRGSAHADPNWTDDLVTAMRQVVKEHFPSDGTYGGHPVVFWWSW